MSIRLGLFLRQHPVSHRAYKSNLQADFCAADRADLTADVHWAWPNRLVISIRAYFLAVLLRQKSGADRLLKGLRVEGTLNPIPIP